MRVHEIKMPPQSGKTTMALALLRGFLAAGRPVLFLVPTEQMRQLLLSANTWVPRDCVASDLSALVKRRPSAVIIDDADKFMSTPEGDAVELAARRVRFFPDGVVYVFSRLEKMDENQFSAGHLAELRTLKGEGMVSAVGEYTPAEFWDALDKIEQQAAEIEAAKAELEQYRRDAERRAQTDPLLTTALATALGYVADSYGDEGGRAVVMELLESALIVIESIDLPLNQQQSEVKPEPKCSACGDSGIVGHSTLCECQQQTEPAPAQDQRESFEADWPAISEHACGEDWKGIARPAQTEQQPVEVMRFLMKHPFSGEAHTVEFTREEVADGMEDAFYEKLAPLVCDCNGSADHECGDYIHDFDLMLAAHGAQTALNQQQAAQGCGACGDACKGKQCRVKEESPHADNWLELAHELESVGLRYWKAVELRERNKGAVKWIKNEETGFMAVVTRGEYSGELKAFCESLPFYSEQPDEVKP